MNAVYTLCSYNHIGRVFSLAQSVREFSPGTRFIIGLIDDAENIEAPEGSEIIRAKDMNIPFLQEMFTKYSSLELNSALKPYFGNFVFETCPDIDKLLFFDTDILFFNSLDPLFELLNSNNSILLSPHSLSTVKNGPDFDDRIFLRSGIYNAGFFGLKRDVNSISFLKWWMEKLRNQGFFDSKKGMFAEQLWLNLVPLYFSGVHILPDPGCNVSYWNLHERTISSNGDRYEVNGKYPLTFFHFSGASIDCIEQDSISEHQTRYTFSNRPDVLPVFRKYVESLRRYSYTDFSRYYTVTGKYKTRSPLVKFITEWYKKIIKKIVYNR